MTPAELRALLTRLGWTIPEAARRLRVPYRTMHAACSTGPHHRELHPAAVRLAELAERAPEARAWLEGAE